MGRRAGWRKFGVWIVVFVLIIWPIYRIYGYLNQHTGSYNASVLLYQVAQFQIELLNSSLTEAAKAQDTRGLDSLRLSAYSANYTHERLVLAVGEGKLTPLHSIDQLVQYVLRVQIGGARALRPDEKETLAKAGQIFKDIFEGYGKLLSSSGKPLASHNDELAKFDEELAELLKKRLLP